MSVYEELLGTICELAIIDTHEHLPARFHTGLQEGNGNIIVDANPVEERIACGTCSEN